MLKIATELPIGFPNDRAIYKQLIFIFLPTFLTFL